MDRVQTVSPYRRNYEPFLTYVTFNKPVPDFQVSDMRLTNGATATAILSNEDDTRYGIEITPVADGTIFYDIEKSRLGLGPTSEVARTQNTIIDTVDPTIEISGVPSATDGTTPFMVTFTVSELLWGYEADYLEINEISVTNGTASNFQATGEKGQKSPPVYTALITPDGNGDVSVSVPANAIEDFVGNPNPATPVATALLDTTAPVVSISGVPSSVGTLPFTATFTVSEETTGFALDDLVVTNGSASAFDASSATVFTALITPDGNGDLSVSVKADAFTDLLGNPNLASQVATAPLDTAPPSVSAIIAEDGDASDGSLSWVVSFSEDVSGVGPDNFDVQGVEGGKISVTPLGPRDQTSLPAFFLRELLGVRRAIAAPASATQYRVTVTGGNVATLTSSAVLVFGSPAGITDGSGQALVSVTPTGVNQSTVNPDTDAPTVAQIVAPAQVQGTFDANVIFSEAVSGFDGTDLTVTNATVDSVTPQSPSGGFATIFTVRLTPLAHGPLTIAVAAGAAADAAGNQSIASGTLTISYLDASFVQARTGAVIRNFLSQRANNILSNQPDLSGRLMDQGGLGATEKFAVSTNYQSGSLQVNFAGSLTRLMSGQTISDMADEKTYGYGGPETAGEGDEEGRTTRFNLWVKGNLSKSKLDGNEQGFGAFHVGADYRVTPDLMLGTLVQFDWADESNAATATSASGTGWFAGPYAVYRLHQNVILDGYVAYGQSDNKVSPFGTYIDSFDTSRFLARGQITGDFDYAGWTIAPQLSASYLAETQKAYVDSNGISIAEQDIEVGQLSFGPSFRKSHVLDNNVVLTPSLAIRGIWNFKKAGTADITTGAITGSAQDKLRARLELGMGAKFTDSFRLTSSGYVDGLGQGGYSGYGGTLGLSLRF
ncbi:MAG: Ig-like domain-containing protein [Hoeflea sp.]|uniref:Ig-like domain-containing protein n=1 Tax=Hoeflea sp. TaxID=1940281 RepID=UPI0032EAA2FA